MKFNGISLLIHTFGHQMADRNSYAAHATRNRRRGGSRWGSSSPAPTQTRVQVQTQSPSLVLSQTQNNDTKITKVPKQKIVTISKKEIIMEFVKLCFELEVSVFGGYVRDQFSGNDSIKDVDILLPNHIQMSQFIADLKKQLAWKIEVSPEAPVQNYKFSKITVTNKLTKITFECDIVIHNEFEKLPPDMDINTLYMPSESTLKIRKPYTVYDIPNILENIRTKKFTLCKGDQLIAMSKIPDVPNDDFSEVGNNAQLGSKYELLGLLARAEKMINRGWTCVNREQLNTFLKKIPETNKKNEEDKCPICFEEFKSDEVYFWTKCNHTFHAQCLRKSFKIHDKIICPLCRQLVF